MNADSLSHLSWEEHQECYTGQVEVALTSSHNTTAVPDESVREQLFQSALEQPTMDRLPMQYQWDTNQIARLQIVDPTVVSDTLP